MPNKTFVTIYETLHLYLNGGFSLSGVGFDPSQAQDCFSHGRRTPEQPASRQASNRLVLSRLIGKFVSSTSQLGAKSWRNVHEVAVHNLSRSPASLRYVFS